MIINFHSWKEFWKLRTMDLISYKIRLLMKRRLEISGNMPQVQLDSVEKRILKEWGLVLLIQLARINSPISLRDWIKLKRKSRHFWINCHLACREIIHLESWVLLIGWYPYLSQDHLAIYSLSHLNLRLLLGLMILLALWLLVLILAVWIKRKVINQWH